ncbi:MAG TPA: hypothetical protein VM073_00310 [Usitatibacter sp.]|nr:hypothetical protein [Usitatibacter sp.]
MTTPARPTIPPNVLEALKRGDKVEAMKLLRQAAKSPAAKAAVRQLAGATATTFKHAHHHDPRRPGLSPGEVPRGEGGFGWIILLAVGIVTILFVLK